MVYDVVYDVVSYEYCLGHLCRQKFLRTYPGLSCVLGTQMAGPGYASAIFVRE